MSEANHLPHEAPSEGNRPALLEEAMLLRQLQHDQPGEAANTRIHAWRQQSPAHERAWQQADAYWCAAGRIERPARSSWRERWALQMNILLEKLRDRESQPLGLPLMTTAALVMVLVWLFPSPADKTTPPTMVADNTATGFTAGYRSAWQEQRTVDLPDGSSLALNWSTRVEVDYQQDRRIVRLDEGEAMVQVKPAPDRPFTIQAGDTRVTALGTSYSVYRQAEDHVTVTVREGTVSVSDERDTTRPVTLSANQQVQVHQGQPGTIQQIDAAARVSWRDGLLIFRQRPLEEALQELARYAGIRLDIESLPPTPSPVTGTYLTIRAADGLSLIAEAHDLRLRQQGNTLRIQHRPLFTPR